jgi:hypothetical protein
MLNSAIFQIVDLCATPLASCNFRILLAAASATYDVRRVTLAVAIVISAIVSLTLAPMMCAKLIRRRPDVERSGFDLHAERALNAIIERYGRALRWVLDR